MQDLTPRQIVEELDRHIVGQQDAKRAVAVAIRNRWRRRRLDPTFAQEVYPKNIIMIGPTGVGKTEIARRLATLTGAPFVKVEASKFTEVGYHGRDVESMVRDLVEEAIRVVRAEQAKDVKEKAEAAANERLVELLLPKSHDGEASPNAAPGPADTDAQSTRALVEQRLRERLAAGALDDREVELTVSAKPKASVMFANMGLEQMDPEMSNMLEKMMPQQSKRRRLPVREARKILLEQETDKLLDPDKVQAEAITRAQDAGIVFLDEIDKIASPGGAGGRSGGGGGGGSGGGGPDVSRQGVQRDLLPIVEGSAVNTRYGVIHTDHVLFIAAGAFHSAAVSDLMPELQGRFPIRVELSPLGKDDFIRILREPRGALTKQQVALLGVEGLTVRFEDAAIDAIADLAAEANASLENIGARRLMTIVEKVFERVNFEAPDMVAQGETEFVVTEAFVREQVEPYVKDKDLSRFVL